MHFYSAYLSCLFVFYINRFLCSAFVFGDFNYRLSLPNQWAETYRTSLARRLIELGGFKALYAHDEVQTDRFVAI